MTCEDFLLGLMHFQSYLYSGTTLFISANATLFANKSWNQTAIMIFYFNECILEVTLTLFEKPHNSTGTT